MALGTIRLNEDLIERARKMSERTGIPIARIAADGIVKELERLESIFRQVDKAKEQK